MSGVLFLPNLSHRDVEMNKKKEQQPVCEAGTSQNMKLSTSGSIELKHTSEIIATDVNYNDWELFAPSHVWSGVIQVHAGSQKVPERSNRQKLR